MNNTQREKHSAVIDTELLAKVYIELLDARELSLDLDITKKQSSSQTSFDISQIQNRDLPRRLTEDEKIAHAKFIETLGDNAIWKKIKNE